MCLLAKTYTYYKLRNENWELDGKRMSSRHMRRDHNLIALFPGHARWLLACWPVVGGGEISLEW
jgi:hypothetical protein